MKSISLHRISIIAVAIFLLSSCSKTNEDFTPATAQDYFPLQVGKFITYRVDSLVFTNFQRVTEIHSYQVKHMVNGTFLNSSGDTAYIVYRYRNDKNADGEWLFDGSYEVTKFFDRVEVVEDNLRFIKLKSVLAEGNTWKGNAYLPGNPYEPFGYKFSIDNDMGAWDYNVDLHEDQSTYENITYDDVFTITSQDKAENYPSDTDTIYAARTLSTEKYAKGIGLVYRNNLMVEHQPNATGVLTDPPYSAANPKIIYDPFNIGFGITMWMIDHN